MVGKNRLLASMTYSCLAMHNYNAKLFDFWGQGWTNGDKSHVSIRVMGTYGYLCSPSILLLCILNGSHVSVYLF
ncbi:hypothetical protein IFM89_028112 [Coptis chinensis]|uniref:Uncharacterized protein n=1 Tax=Coptis chinensis TaxID=261450 RepID=A0A835HVZ9_9MAGN|nr:hypothetical protein IFM89_028112 [Coptis chinensis]